MRDIVNFLFEVGVLKKIPRSGYKFLGTGSESVADHSFRVAVIAYVLAKHELQADLQKVVLMSLFHDIHEARTGDHNYVNKQYVIVNEDKAVRDLAQGLPSGEEIVSLTANSTREKHSRQGCLRMLTSLILSWSSRHNGIWETDLLPNG